MGKNGSVLLVILFVCLLLALPSRVSAQRIRGGAMRASQAIPARPIARASTRPVGPVALRGARALRPVAMQRSNGVRVNGERSVNRPSPSSNDIASRQSENQFGSGLGLGAPLDLEQLLNISPTNGFNWQYVNAINQDLPLKAIVDPVTRLEIAQAEHLLRIGGGQFSGAYILGGGYGYYVPEETAEDQAPPDAEQPQPQTQEESQTTQPRVIVLQQKPSTNEAQASAPPAIPGEGEFTLILRNGEKLEVIAFTRADGKIVYITPDGDRKSIDAAELDSAATERLNEERGTPLQLSGS